MSKQYFVFIRLFGMGDDIILTQLYSDSEISAEYRILNQGECYSYATGIISVLAFEMNENTVNDTTFKGLLLGNPLLIGVQDVGKRIRISNRMAKAYSERKSNYNEV